MNQLFESKNTWRLNSLQVFMMVLTRYWIEYCLECITERIKHAVKKCFTRRNATNSLRSANECATSNSFLFHRFGFGTRSVQNLKEIGSFGSHTRMNVSFATLDVVMQVVTEQMNQIDGIISNIFICVPRKQH